MGKPKPAAEIIMSSNDEKARRAWRARLQQKFEEQVRNTNALLTMYVQAGNQYISNEQVERLIRSVYPKTVFFNPYDDGRKQYKIEVKKAYVDALYEAWPVLEISNKAFKKPGWINLNIKPATPTA